VGRRIVAGSAAVFAAAGLFVAGGGLASAAPKPPPNPTNGQINAARNAKQALATRVGQLSGQLAQAQNELQALQGKAQLAEQKAALAQSQLQAAKVKSQQTQAAVVAAKNEVDKAHTQFVRYIQATYMSGDVNGTAGSLLSAQDPTSLLETSALQQYQAEHSADAVGKLESATVARSNAEAAARGALQRQAVLTQKAKDARVAAFAAVQRQQQQTVALNHIMATTQTELNAAQEQLATLNNQRAAFLAYQAEQARLARIRAEKARQARLAAERARRAREQHGGGGGGGGYSAGPPPSGGNWSATKGNRAADRALSQLGMPYIWAAGSRYGPDTGGCTDPIAPCGTVGFDCSGLVLYAWGRDWAHFAASQYYVGSYHPSPGNFRRGDLLFWSDNGTVGGIGHVAIYIGNGNVVQAPQSGDVVKITPWDQVEFGYYGATRPLT
jgi:peptidoglycan DL-endopeptidase RipA